MRTKTSAGQGRARPRGLAGGPCAIVPQLPCPPVDAIAELSSRGAVQITAPDDLARHLAAEPVTLYWGIDATADSLHVGQLVGLMVVRRLQRAGHRPILLLGGGTTLVGDPSGKDSERPLLSEEEIAANAAAIRAQLERFLDFGPDGAVLLDNADWLRPLG